MRPKGNEMTTTEITLAEYRAMADFLDDTDFDFSEATQKEYNALAADAIAAGFYESQYQFAADEYDMTHMVAVGDATPLCGGDYELTDFSYMMAASVIDSDALANNPALACRECAQEFAAANA